jgi:hypothetical protein
MTPAQRLPCSIAAARAGVGHRPGRIARDLALRLNATAGAHDREVMQVGPVTIPKI